jgi:hypothetical protein
MSNAQNQHYVPKFILRQFLINRDKEQVSVYDKHDDKIFITTIKNIMAERRFNNFSFKDLEISFEKIACGIEDLVLPAYHRIVETRRLNGSPQEKADLGFLVAFQFLRTKAARERYQDLEMVLKAKVEEMGGQMEDINGWEPSTEESIKMENLVGLRDSLFRYAPIIAQKDFLLAEALPGRSFYLGDNPVCLHNSRDFGPLGNLGLGVPGIEIYLPLSSELMLCAWCPSHKDEIHRVYEKGKETVTSESLSALMAGKISGPEMKSLLENYRRTAEIRVLEVSQAISEGIAISSNTETMDFYNSLQCIEAYRYIVCPNSDFALARRHNKEFPQLRKGRQLSFG